jgi:uncharacterized protein (TIGR03437 family)
MLLACLPALAQPPRIQPCDILPADNVWNNPIDALPVDSRSGDYINRIGAAGTMAANFGSGRVNGAPVGIPYTLVPGSQNKVSMRFENATESDPGPYPIPPNAAVEGGSSGAGERRVLVIETDNCVLYELSRAFPEGDGWRGANGAVYDLKANGLRPANWASADIAGLAVLPALVRYDEVLAGEIRHALRFTAPSIRQAYVWPARDSAGANTDATLPPYGQRFRLKPEFDVSGFSPQTQVILRALKKYGMFLAETGPAWTISGAPDDRWNNDALRELARVRGSDLEAVDTSSLVRDPNAAYVRPETRIDSVGNAASYRPGYLAPGMIASIFGVGLANEPTQTRVTFDGTLEAPVILATPRQINFVVPYATASKNSWEMFVRYQSLLTFRGQVNVGPASPGIFALDASGKGGGAILNQDTTVNSPQNPAAKGSIIVLYATGGGQTNPPGRDGRIANAPNLPVPVLPVKVRIGGVESQVQYAGAAPGFIAGAMQINVRLPATAPSGNVPVILDIGGWPSQEGLTVAIQ